MSRAHCHLGKLHNFLNVITLLQFQLWENPIYFRHITHEGKEKLTDFLVCFIILLHTHRSPFSSQALSAAETHGSINSNLNLFCCIQIFYCFSIQTIFSFAILDHLKIFFSSTDIMKLITGISECLLWYKMHHFRIFTYIISLNSQNHTAVILYMGKLRPQRLQSLMQEPELNCKNTRFAATNKISLL